LIFNLGIRLIISPLCATWATVNPQAKSAFIRFGNVAIFNKWLWMDTKAHLVHTAKVGYISIYCPSCPANGFFCRIQQGIIPRQIPERQSKKHFAFTSKFD
jgi:hypothetical protein